MSSHPCEEGGASSPHFLMIVYKELKLVNGLKKVFLGKFQTYYICTVIITGYAAKFQKNLSIGS